MIIKRRSELEIMAEAAVINREALAVVEAAVAPGVTTSELNALAEDAILSRGGKPAFKGYNGFPATICASPNEVVVHGFPNDRHLREGDVISIDIGTFYRGYAADMARTYAVGKVSVDASRLLEVTERSLYAGIERAQAGNRLGDVSAAIQDVVEAAGYWVVREFVGHGIGREFHEGPEVPNFGRAGTGPVLRPGLVLAIEPMVAQRRSRVVIADDGWTASTENGSLAAHFEHTVAITEDGPWVLTASGGTGVKNANPTAPGGVHGA
ncbi:MAG TPA: type I methionyl aminopeptidase [Trueperaceae bacterium]|nr:type I methionyl aminopeptidase [Trueperaceae bacterium]HRP47505.1 type I methionyl aminopeptidase [Trueperaceae bacterium]